MNKRVGIVFWAVGLGCTALGLAACSSNPQTPAGEISHGAREFGRGIAGEASDTAITTKIKAKMAANTGLSSFHIHVKTINGVVTLTGTVDTAATRELAAHTAADTEGVVRVINDLHVGQG